MAKNFFDYYSEHRKEPQVRKTENNLFELESSEKNEEDELRKRIAELEAENQKLKESKGEENE